MWTTNLPAKPRIIPRHFAGVNSVFILSESKKDEVPPKNRREFPGFSTPPPNPPPKIVSWDSRNTASRAFPLKHPGYSSYRQMACGVETAFRLTRRGASVINHSARAVSCAGSTHIPARGQALTAYRGNTTFCFFLSSASFLSCLTLVAPLI